MQAYLLGGRPLSFASDRAAIALGHSERRAVGEAWAEDLEQRGFNEIEIFTTNQLAQKRGRLAIVDYFAGATVLSHSRGSKEMPKARQAVLFNPMEPVPMLESMIRAGIIASDSVKKEPNAHKTGIGDLALAGVELLRQPQTSIATLRSAPRYSTTQEYSMRQKAGDFPAGVTIVHSLQDAYGFPRWENMLHVTELGMASILIDDCFHNSVVFAPRETMDAVLNAQELIG